MNLPYVPELRVDPTVCRVDGVQVVQGGITRTRWFHTDDLPRGVDPEHEVDPMPQAEYDAARQARSELVAAVDDLLLHHATLHPLDGCDWAARVRHARRSA